MLRPTSSADVRSLYPHAVVRSRDPLASLAGNAWYVYRDGRYSPFSDGPALVG